MRPLPGIFHAAVLPAGGRRNERSARPGQPLREPAARADLIPVSYARKAGIEASPLKVVADESTLNARLAAIVRSSVEAIFSTTLEGAIASWNDAAARLYGYSEAEIVGEHVTRLLPPARADVDQELFRSVLGGSPIDEYETQRVTKDGRVIDIVETLSPVRHPGGGMDGVAAIGRDISQRRRSEREHTLLLAQLKALARTDELTGLPNRRAWDEELGRELALATRQGEPLCVAILDIDRFKRFNDRYGHDAGDALLKASARAWKDQLRASDFLARHGGEEFAILLMGHTPDEAMAVTERMRGATPSSQTCSVGLAFWDGFENADAVMRRADAALYAAKRRGRDRVIVAEPPAPVA